MSGKAKGVRRRLSPSRKLVVEMLHHARKQPSVPVGRAMNVGRLAALILSGMDVALLDRFARELARVAPAGPGILVLGPAPAPLALLRGRHRRRFLLKCRRDIAPQPLLRTWLGKVKMPASLRLQVDIDPYSFL